MKPSILMFLSTLATATFSLSAAAYSVGAAPELKPGSPPMNCATAKDRARCESLNKDIEACRYRTGDEWRECMHRPPPAVKLAPPNPRDCTKASNREVCEAHNAALEACKDKDVRAEHRKCMALQQSAAAAR
jgi:transposase